MISWYTWLAALLLSLLLHAALASLFDEALTIEGYALAEGEGGVEVGLGLAGSYVDTQASEPSSKEKNPSEPSEFDVTPAPSPVPQVQVTPLREAVSVDVAPSPEIVPAAIVLPEVQVAPVLPKEPDAPRDTETETSDTEATLDQKVHTHEPDNSQLAENLEMASPPHAAAASVRATGSENTVSAGGNAGDARSYFSTIMAQLAAHKTYPPELKKRKREGVVKLAFSVRGNGQIFAASVEKSSGIKQLDAAALAMLEAASPLPPIPKSMNRDSLQLVIPVEYSLITNRFK